MADAEQAYTNKSPFPGMDPFLEKRWSDLHARMTTYASDAIADQLPPGLVARLEEYLALEGPGEDPITYRPDVSTFETAEAESPAMENAPESEAAQPVLVARRAEPETLRYVKILETGTGQLVTTVEFLSPRNKVGAGAEQFREKQRELRQAGVNVVEIDLLRGGQWVISAPEGDTPRRVCGPYRICVVRRQRPLTAEMYEVSLRKPLPTIRIPLRASDRDIPLNLQKLFETAYARGGYQMTDYTEDPIPALDATDAAWADDLLRKQGKR